MLALGGYTPAQVKSAHQEADLRPRLSANQGYNGDTSTSVFVHNGLGEHVYFFFIQVRVVVL